MVDEIMRCDNVIAVDASNHESVYENEKRPSVVDTRKSLETL